MSTLRFKSHVSDGIVVLYHKGCNDGTAAAYVAKSYLGDDGVTYKAWQYGDEIPDIYNKDVYLLDLSLTPEGIEEFQKAKANRITIIDHHKTAIEGLAGVKTARRVKNAAEITTGDFLVFCLDNEYCGAVLTWRFFNPDRDFYPVWLSFIQDYDLWVKELEETDPVNKWLAQNRSFKAVEHLSDPDNLDEIVRAGKMLIDYDNSIIDSVTRSYVQLFFVKDFGPIPFINAPHHLRNEIADQYRNTFPLVVLYTQRTLGTIYSLRSGSDGPDVSALAKMHGGGGHRGAAAFKTEHSRLTDYHHEHLFSKPGLLDRLMLCWHVLRGKI